MWHFWAMSSVCYLLGLYDADVCGSAYRLGIEGLIVDKM